MRNKPPNLQNRVSAISYLIILFIMIINSSCEKEDIIPHQTYAFQDYLYPENICCYDTSGNKLDSLSYMYSEDDLIYTDDFHIPYDKIEIFSNNKMVLYLKNDGGKTLNGIIDQENDTLYFYNHKINPYNFLFKAVITGNQLKIPGCGYIYYSYVSNGFIDGTGTEKTITLGTPGIESLIDEFPDGPFVNSEISRIKALYVQKFELIYTLQ